MLFRCQRCGKRSRYRDIRETFAGLLCKDTAACHQRPVAPLEAHR